MIEPARIDDLPDEFASSLQDRLSDGVIVFDGVCVLCSGWALWVVRRGGGFHFVTAQSRLGTALLQAHDLPVDDYSSNLVLLNGLAYTRFDSMIAVLTTLGWPWKEAGVLSFLPGAFKDWLYTRIAKNRFALFGIKESCDIPSPELRSRLLG